MLSRVSLAFRHQGERSRPCQALSAQVPTASENGAHERSLNAQTRQDCDGFPSHERYGFSSEVAA